MSRNAKLVSIVIALIMALSLIPLSLVFAATTSVTANIVGGGPTFNRPFMSTGCGGTLETSDYYYNASNTFTVPATGAYEVQDMYPGGLDGFLFFYNGPFNPAAPLTNCFFGVDDFEGYVILPAGTYTIVLSTYDYLDTGTTTFEIRSLTTAAPNAAPAAGPQWFPGYFDNRINWREAYSPVALYAVDAGDGSYDLHIYRIGANGGELALVVTPAMIAAAPEHPAAPALMAATEDGFIRVFRLPDGQFQVVVGPDGEGKTTFIVFDRVCPGRSCAQYSTWQTP